MKLYLFGTAVLATLATSAVLFAKPAPPKAEAVPVIAELFTSEGCSSCPPADTLLKGLAETQPIPGAQVIELGYHVDYWDRLGWRDPFSSAAYSARQEQYRVRFGNEQVYTPQMIVNGNTEFVGSDAERARRDIQQAAEQMRHSPVRVAIVPVGQDRYNITVAGTPKQGVSNLWVAVTENGLRSEVKRGENAGRHLDHVAVVRRLIRLGNKTAATVSLPPVPGEKRENAHVVVWVQQGEIGTIIGATQVAR